MAQTDHVLVDHLPSEGAVPEPWMIPGKSDDSLALRR
jgi:hypothetical protein